MTELTYGMPVSDKYHIFLDLGGGIVNVNQTVMETSRFGTDTVTTRYISSSASVKASMLSGYLGVSWKAKKTLFPFASLGIFTKSAPRISSITGQESDRFYEYDSISAAWVSDTVISTDLTSDYEYMGGSIGVQSTFGIGYEINRITITGFVRSRIGLNAMWKDSSTAMKELTFSAGLGIRYRLKEEYKDPEMQAEP